MKPLRRTATGPTKPPFRYVIEGKSVTFAEIAERIGTTPNGARYRFSKVRKLAGPVTWQKLKEAA
jgi:hypothetical protein